ncbi:unnamed protein product [Leptosia nina]|uniref:Uncharacterized protein n=1 Tax=Leptosia nina TaxID=320188 RepID=A0AAV1JY83_9NEOP
MPAPHLSLTGGGMLKAGNNFALGFSNSIAIVLFNARAFCTRPRVVAAGRTLTVTGDVTLRRDVTSCWLQATLRRPYPIGAERAGRTKPQ